MLFSLLLGMIIRPCAHYADLCAFLRADLENFRLVLGTTLQNLGRYAGLSCSEGIPLKILWRKVRPGSVGHEPSVGNKYSTSFVSRPSRRLWENRVFGARLQTLQPNAGVLGKGLEDWAPQRLMSSKDLEAVKGSPGCLQP